MKLIVGLGNPLKKYEKTRHNIGFIMLDAIAQHNNLKIIKKRFGGKYGEYFYNDEKIILLKPYKYINLSGEVISKYINYFKIEIDNILIICDDLNMEIGKIKLKYKGTSGGHNGLKNIEQHLGTQNYKRLKIGILNNNFNNARNYVLDEFSNEESKQIEQVKQQIPLIINDYLKQPFELVMNKYNEKGK